MAVRLSDMRAKISTTTATWDGEDVEVGYHPAAMTPALLEDATAAAEAGDLNSLSVMLEPLLAWWDVLDDDGERIPPTAEQIRVFPLSFSVAVLTAVQGAMRPPTPGT